jgi:ABC-type sugar transport system permease subunit
MLRPPIDPTLSNFIGLLSTAVILVAFLFAPWYWFDMKFNGARLMSEAIIDGTYSPYVTWHIILVPIAALLTLMITLWGLNSPERGTLASYATAVFGLISLFYFFNFYYLDHTEYIVKYVRDTDQMSKGFYWALAGTVGLIAQTIFLGISVIPRGTLPQVSLGAGGIKQRWADFTISLSKPRPDGKPYLMSRKEMTAWMFLIVPLILYLVWIIGPTLYTFYLSLTDWDGVTKEAWVGLDNYRDLFHADNFRIALGNNVRWFIIFITVPTTLGLFMAMIFNTEIRAGRWYKVSFYSPLVLSGPVIALVWTWVYHPRNGLLNTILVDGGFTDNPPGWLAESSIAIYCIIAAAVWRQVGYVMVLYLAGLKNLDPTLMDAGLVDGANRWQLFRHVIFPLLAPITTIIVIISIIDSLRAFDLVQIMTRGNQKTEVLANLMFMEAFNNYRMGYGAAIAVVLFSISIFFVGIYLWRTLKDELEY